MCSKRAATERNEPYHMHTHGKLGSVYASSHSDQSLLCDLYIIKNVRHLQPDSKYHQTILRRQICVFAGRICNKVSQVAPAQFGHFLRNTQSRISHLLRGDIERRSCDAMCWLAIPHSSFLLICVLFVWFYHLCIYANIYFSAQMKTYQK